MARLLGDSRALLICQCETISLLKKFDIEIGSYTNDIFDFSRNSGFLELV